MANGSDRETPVNGVNTPDDAGHPAQELDTSKNPAVSTHEPQNMDTPHKGVNIEDLAKSMRAEDQAAAAKAAADDAASESADDNEAASTVEEIADEGDLADGSSVEVSSGEDERPEELDDPREDASTGHDAGDEVAASDAIDDDTLHDTSHEPAPTSEVSDDSEDDGDEDSPLASAPLPGPYVEPGTHAGRLPWIERSMLDDIFVRSLVICVGLLVFFPGLGSFGLWDPWEVHYGEVGRQLVERHDWITPWWGSHWQVPGHRSPEGEPFFSKPILLLWMMGLGLQVFGFSEFGIRFGVATIALLGVVSVYMMGSHVWKRRTGVLMAGALLTSPFYFMLGRQAQTDMPFVGLMTVALSFFVMGVFGRHRNKRLDRTSLILFGTVIATIVLPQLHTITVGQLNFRYERGDGLFRWVEAVICYGPVQLAFYLLLAGLFAITFLLNKQRTRGQLYLWIFYAFVGLATMGKGLLGFALPGAIILIYLIVSREWGLLRRVELVRGICVTLLVGLPWYGAVMALNGGIGGTWWTRFIIHDHFKRLATGVHQIDTGSFEHFIRWLGYGLFPWGSFVPAVLARAMSGTKMGARSDGDRARTFIFIWFFLAFSLFTLSSTKFHHYIFPAVPALALLAALFIDDVLDGGISWTEFWPLYVASGALLVLVGFDLMSDPQHLKNLFTYRYDREWDHEAWDASIKFGIRFIFAGAALGFLLLSAARWKKVVRAGVVVLMVNGLIFATWTLNHYMPLISTTWSQKGLWDHYYESCTQVAPPRGAPYFKHGRYCMESAIGYRLNWRGETYYTQNDVIPIRDDTEWEYFLDINGDRCFYAIMEYARINSFRNALPAEQRASVRTAYDGNIKFALVSANCPDPDEDEDEDEGESPDTEGEVEEARGGTDEGTP